MRPLRLLLADDHTLVRAGLRALLDGIDGVTVVAEADNGEQAVALAAEQRPDIALLDITMPGMNGLAAAERILRELPGVRVLILSMHAGEEYVHQALKLGVSGYHAGASASCTTTWWPAAWTRPWPAPSCSR